MLNEVSQLIEARNLHISSALSLAHGTPIHIIKGEMQYLYSSDGSKYLDLVNNVSHVGHCNPVVVEAGQRQMAVLNTNSRYLYDGLTDYVSRLASTLPEPLSVGFLVNSGSEANELAIRLARAHTGNHDIAVIDGAYHGHTGMLIDLSPYKFRGPGGKGEPEPWVRVLPIPDSYRREGEDFTSEADNELDRDGEVAGLLVESMLSCAGQVLLPEGYLRSAHDAVSRNGGLLIADEVQVGFGRVGTHMWAFQETGVVPDIVVMGKPIGNGHPMAAVFTTTEIASSFRGMEFFSTFGGNPVSCAIGMAVMDVIEQEELLSKASTLGSRLMMGLNELKESHEIIGDVRGRGLFLGIEMVMDRETLEPAHLEAAELVDKMRERGVLLSTDGPLHNVIKIKPPMVLSEKDVDETLAKLDVCL
ncbi:MAG: aspartate aminotransferase family protein [Methanobacteriota archaeon]|nr:MAG: aspartate aminotransferase family protein [Euryarchaeota archaeon]|tara:strand:+ start:13342 stop:14592 length:1251 start_codon:yes stop_codon:yes gene_type:complete